MEQDDGHDCRVDVGESSRYKMISYNANFSILCGIVFRIDCLDRLACIGKTSDVMV
jgi:hypothetical protein